METSNRSLAALANRQASSNRSGNCCRHPEPHAGAGTPQLRPHRIRPRGPALTASTRLIHASSCQYDASAQFVDAGNGCQETDGGAKGLDIGGVLLIDLIDRPVDGVD